MKTATELQQLWEEKQSRIKHLIDTDTDNRTEEIERLGLEIHELMRQHYELTA